ncbi:retrovirus-related pol polyprotein from transposon TNT 1-94 [Tanacetum coccineum]
MMASSHTCLLSKASKTKSWLWNRRLSHLNFGVINHLARHGLVRGLPKLKFEKDHLCSACAMGKSKKKPYKPKSEDTNQEKLYLLHMDLCEPMRVASVNGKKTYNGTEFVNQTLREYYEKVGISHETSVARSPWQNGVVERHNRTLIEAARTTLIYAKAPLFLWAKAVATAYFDEQTTMASEHSSSGPALHEMTPATISLGLVPNPPPSTPIIPTFQEYWGSIGFQPYDILEWHSTRRSLCQPTGQVCGSRQSESCVHLRSSLWVETKLLARGTNDLLSKDSTLSHDSTRGKDSNLFALKLMRLLIIAGCQQILDVVHLESMQVLGDRLVSGHKKAEKHSRYPVRKANK